MPKSFYSVAIGKQSGWCVHACPHHFDSGALEIKPHARKKVQTWRRKGLKMFEIRKWMKDESGMQHATTYINRLPYFIVLPNITKRDGLFGRNATVLVGVIIDDLETPMLFDSFNVMFDSWTCEFYSNCSWSHCQVWRHTFSEGWCPPCWNEIVQWAPWTVYSTFHQDWSEQVLPLTPCPSRGPLESSFDSNAVAS